MNPLQSIGNFFGGIFGQKKKDEEEKPRQAATVQKPAATLSMPVQAPSARIQGPSPVMPSSPQVLGGVNRQTAQLPSDFQLTVRPQQNPVVRQEEKKDDRPFVEKIGAGIQQGVGRFADTLVQGGGLLGQVGALTNPFANDDQRERQLQRVTNEAESLRSAINRVKDVSGNSIVGNRDVDQAAGRIAAGQGTVQDLSAVAGRGLDVAGTATMFVNPARTLTGVANGIQPIRSLIPAVGREAALYGGLEGTQASLDTYGQTGDIVQALQEFVPAAGIGALSQLGLEGLAYGGGRAIRGIAGRTPLVRSVERAGEDAAGFSAESVSPVENRLPEIVEAPSAPRDPSSPITQSPATNKAPAITSANPDFVPPSVQAPVVNMPESIGVRQPEIQMPVVNRPDVLTPDEAVAAAQKSIDDAANAPVVRPAETDVAPVLSRSDADTVASLENAAPVDARAVADDFNARTASDAPDVAVPDELGSIAQKAVQSGSKLDDAGWEALAARVGQAANEEAKRIGTDIETILGKVQAAADNKKIKTAKQAGLSDAEFDLYNRVTDELDYVRNRADVSLVTGGKISRFYSPRQSKDTEYDPDLVNERSRGSGGLSSGDIDLSTVPVEQYVRRYGNAENVVSKSIVDTVENVPQKEGGVIPSGIKVSPEAKAKLDAGAKEYIARKDDIERALAQTDMKPAEINELAKDMDATIDQAFKELIESIPKNTAEGREAITRLTAQRGAYLQSYVRSNMFSNVVNRSMDQFQSGIIKSTNQLLGIADSLVNAGSTVLAKGGAARSVARQYSKGALGRQIARDFRTNMALGSDNPAAKADRAYRAGSTALTSLGDLTTTTVKTANLAMLARAQAEGITDRAGLEKYLRENLNSAEYKDLLQGVQDVYAGYTSLPASAGSRLGRSGTRLSKLDNAIRNSEKLKELGVPERVRSELNDLIMPALTGFAGATYRVGAKSLNAALLGVPGIVKGVRIAKEGGETARQIGRIMVARSLVDGVTGGAAAAAATGAMIGSMADWTGEYPEDPAERARWERQGIVPNALSFDLGNGEKLQVQPGRLLGVFALPVVLPAVIKSGGNLGEVFDGTLGQMLENLGVDSALQNAGTIATALTGSGYQRENAVKKLVNSAGFSTSSVIPLSGALNNVANATDDVKRETSGNFGNVIANRIPGARQTLEEKTDSLGDPVRNNVQGSLGSSVFSTSRNGTPLSSGTRSSSASVDDEITRLAGAKFEVLPSQDVKNANSKTDAQALLGTDLYRNADDDKKSEYLNETLKGTKTKDFSKNLSASQRASLVEHKLQSEDQRKVWLENNDNAAAYYEADYQNAKLNGTLTSDDDNLQNKSGKRYKSVVASVNKETGADNALKQLYGDTSESEWRAMINPESDGYDPDTAARLKAYDDARTAKGVSGKDANSSKPKYVAKNGGGSGKGGKNFTFASLPSSLLGSKGGTGSGSKYADDAPLFKPVADLKVPEKAVPKGRTISVKKGLQV